MRKVHVKDVCPKCDQETLRVSRNEKFIYCSDVKCLWNVESEIWIELWECQ